MISPQMLIAGAVAVGVGGLAFVFLGGDSAADKRRAAIKRDDPKTVSAAAEKVARKKQVADSLKELEKKRNNSRPDLQTRIEQAGLSISKQQYYLFSLIAALALAGLVWLKTESLIVALMFAVIGGLGAPGFLLTRLRNRRIKKFINGLPNAIDIIVRGVKSGLPLGDTIRMVANEADEPVKSEFRRIVESQAVGLALPEAVERMTSRVPITETNFFSIVIAIQSRAGGNLSEALGNLSKVLRDRKKMKGKIGAMAMEAKASAVIIGLVPFFVTFALYMSSPKYIMLLWTTSHGRIVSVVACCWMAIGAAIMKKMINFDF